MTSILARVYITRTTLASLYYITLDRYLEITDKKSILPDIRDSIISTECIRSGDASRAKVLHQWPDNRLDGDILITNSEPGDPIDDSTIGQTISLSILQIRGVEPGYCWSHTITSTTIRHASKITGIVPLIRRWQ